MDVRIGLGAGTFAAGMAGVPAVVAATWTGYSLTSAVLAAAAVGVLFGVAAALTPRRFEMLRRPRVAIAALAAPGVALVAVVAVALVAPDVLGWGAVAVFVAIAGLLALRSGACTHHARRVTGSGAGVSLPETDRRLSAARQRVTYAILGLGWLLLPAGAVWYGTVEVLADPWTLLGAVAGAGFLLAAVVARRDLSLVDAGLLVETPLSARLYEWDEFSGFYRGEQLVLLRSEPWVDDVAFAVDEVSEDALTAVARRLPERERRSVPAGDRRGRAGGESPGDV